MKDELNKALEKRQQILLLIKEGIEEYHPEFIKHARHTIKFRTIDGLLTTLNTLDIQAIQYTSDDT